MENEDFIYHALFMDIVNICNARCPYCLTGSRNRKGMNKEKKAKYMDLCQFSTIIDHLLDKNILAPGSWVGLYNWYEPMLNPELASIINFAGERGLEIGISTNGSVIPDMSDLGDCSHIDEVIFSMCGFSQSSYDRIHGLDIEKVKTNISDFTKLIRRKGFKGTVYIHFHVYQFNIGEVYAAKEFADSIGISIKFTYAYFNNDEFQPYLDGTMSSERLREVSKDLFFCYLDDLFSNIDYYESKFTETPSLTISENGNMIIDRNVNDDSAICSIMEIDDANQARQLMEDHTDHDEIYRKIQVWGHTFNMTINHLFGFECDLPDTIKPLH